MLNLILAFIAGGLVVFIGMGVVCRRLARRKKVSECGIQDLGPDEAVVFGDDEKWLRQHKAPTLDLFGFRRKIS